MNICGLVHELGCIAESFSVHLDFLHHPSDPIVKDQGRGATPGGMAASSTPVSSSSMMAGKLTATGVSATLEVLMQENEKKKKSAVKPKQHCYGLCGNSKGDVFYYTESLRRCKFSVATHLKFTGTNWSSREPTHDSRPGHTNLFGPESHFVGTESHEGQPV